MGKKIHLYFYLKSFFLIFLRNFFNYLNGGESCIICGKKSFFIPLCRNCRKKYFTIVESTFDDRCSKCGRELISTQNICSSCRENPILKSTDKVFPIFSYRLWNKELLFMWKINEVRNLSYFFSSIVEKTLKVLDYKIIVPVPPRNGKIKKKGWDQIDELCEILEKCYGFTCLKLLQRLSKEEQKKLNREERLETIKNAYSLVNKKSLVKELKKTGGVMPDSVCLIDDVCTTGATAECCSEILKAAGIKEANVITLFIVD